jgi:hypothetical protein
MYSSSEPSMPCCALKVGPRKRNSLMMSGLVEATCEKKATAAS